MSKSKEKKRKKKEKANDPLLSGNVRSDNYNEDQDNIINDRFNLVYWVCMILGCGILIAYNFLVTAADYFSDEFPDYNIMFYIVPVYTVPDVLALIVMIFYGNILSFTTQIVICFLTTGIAIGALPFLVQTMSQLIGFWIVLSISAIIGLTTAVLQSAIIAFCNFLPVKYIQISISGQAIAGIAASVIRIGTKLYEQYGNISGRTSGLIYFIVGAVFDIFCVFSFLYVVRSAFVKFHLKPYFWTRKYRKIKNKNNTQPIPSLERTDTQTLFNKIANPKTVITPTAKDFEEKFNFKNVSPTQNNRITIKKKKVKRTGKQKKLAASLEKQKDTYMRFREKSAASQLSDESGSDLTSDDDGDDDEEMELTKSALTHDTCSGTATAITTGSIQVIKEQTSKNKIENINENDVVTYFGVFKKIWTLSFAVFLVFFVTFLPYPGMIVSLDSEYSWVQDNDWLPVFLITEFNVCDFIGRQFVASWTSFAFNKKNLWIGCLWRIFIYPIYIALYKGWISNDFIAYGATGVLAITNGHFCCLCFMWVPSMVKPNEQQICGAIMSFSLVAGITLGSNIALALSFFI